MKNAFNIILRALENCFSKRKKIYMLPIIVKSRYHIREIFMTVNHILVKINAT